MKRFLSALALCTVLLLLGAYFLIPASHAKENVLLTLLNLPAPPPPNPLVRPERRMRDPKFFDRANPPKDDAPIEDLIDYWTMQGENYNELAYNLKPSEKVLERLLGEAEKNPDILNGFLDSLPENRRTADFVKGMYDRMNQESNFDRGERASIRRWLKYHTSEFSGDLAGTAQQVKDVSEYVGNQEELLALTRVDFERARPVVDRLYSDPTQRVSQVLAKWALYRHALDEDSIDVDRYRDELKAVVEDTNATAGMRDLALDALVKEKDWPGRDDWYYSLMSDETLADLRVNGSTYTGLTTIIYYFPPDKYVPKMAELLGSSNNAVRLAAVKNLIVALSMKPNPGTEREIIKALLPWLENPKWIKAAPEVRQTIVQKLATIELRESVPGLISIMNEKIEQPKKDAKRINRLPAGNSGSAVISNANVMMADADPDETLAQVWGEYPYRNSAIIALGTQKDGRAAPALRRVLNEVGDYQRVAVIHSLLMCNGFSVPEQVEALEAVAKKMPAEGNTPRAYVANMAVASAMNAAANAANTARRYTIINDYPVYNIDSSRPREIRPATAEEIKMTLGSQMMQMSEPSDLLVKGVVDRIEALDKRDPTLATTLRRVMIAWQGKAVSSMLLRDLKNDRLESAGIVRLLADREELRTNLQSEVYDARGGSPTASGIASCIIGDTADYDTILSGESAEAKTALLACARLIRAQLPVQKAAENLHGKDTLLATAAERYLESEDSPEARAIVLALHPNEAKILGATTAFAVENGVGFEGPFVRALFASVNLYFNSAGYYGIGYSGDFDESEKKLQKEVKENPNLLGVYSYENNFVRIYKDRAVFSWEDDVARSRERTLTAEEFARLKDYLAMNKVDELAPFLACYGECEAKELLMLGRNGGRRVFGRFTKPPEFFAGLDKFFADAKIEPARIKYNLSKELPGLEVLFADDDLAAQAVWKNGDDFRLLVASKSAEKKVEDEIVDMQENSDENDEESDYEKAEKIREDRKYEGFAWRKFANGVGEAVAQPSQVEFLPLHDSVSVQPDTEQWKARAGDFEIRTGGESGLYRVRAGKAVKILNGNYGSPVVSANGRWVVAEKYVEDEGNSLVRINLLTGREYVIPFQDYPTTTPTAFIPALNKFLIVGRHYSDGEDSSDDEMAVEPGEVPSRAFYLLDADTGLIAPTPGEMRPLAQQTFRALQPAANANQFWAAIPDAKRNETNVGIYDARQMKFTSALRIPKILFSSMDMWVDEAAKKIYFVYSGHLLALPMAK